MYAVNSTSCPICSNKCLRISYGSLKESLYLIDFSHRQGYLSEQQFIELKNKGEEVAKMIWATLQTLTKKS